MELTEPRPCGATATKPASKPCTQCMTAAKRNSWHAPHISTRLEETNSFCIWRTEVRVEKQLPIFDLPRHLTENRKNGPGKYFDYWGRSCRLRHRAGGFAALA